MIQLKNITWEREERALTDINLTVEDSEIFLLLCKDDGCGEIFCDIFGGLQEPGEGVIQYDGKPLNTGGDESMTIIRRVDVPNFFDQDLKLQDMADFNCISGGLSRKRLLEILLLFNIFEADLKQRVRSASHSVIKALYLSLLLTKDTKNIVIHDFIRGEEKEFELTFNRVLLQLKEEGKAILYITDDVFYAYRIADRVSFIKNGYLLPSEPIESKDLKELDTMEVYKQYLM